jgi:alpha-1,2-mannosyltransferase
MPATVGRRPTSHRAVNRLDRRIVGQIGAIAVVWWIAWQAVQSFGRSYEFFDMKIYHGAMVWWAGGGDLYEFIAPGTTLGFTYPPFAALLMLPMTGLSTVTAGWLNAVASVAALALILVALLQPVAQRAGWPLWFTAALALPLALAIEPSRETLGYGQVNLLLFALIMADMVALRRRSCRAGSSTGGRLRRFWSGGTWAGIGIGLATAIKVFPALFIVYLALTRQWRAAVTAFGTAATVTLITFSIAGPESSTYFTRMLWHTDRVGPADMTPNQSLAGVLARLYDSAEAPGLLYITFASVILVIGLSRAGSAHADGDELAAFTLVGLTANVISPISWSHHHVFVIPAIIVLADAALRRRSASRSVPARIAGPETALSGVNSPRPPIWFPTLTGLRHASAALGVYLLFLVSPIWAYEHRFPQVSHYQDGLFGVAMENSLALALIILVTALPWRPSAYPVFTLGATARADRRPSVTSGACPGRQEDAKSRKSAGV